MTVYSHNGGVPAPLPHLIWVTDDRGRPRSRTAQTPFSPEELTEAGFVEAEAAPNPNARQLPAVWNGSAWSLPAKSVATRKAEMLNACRLRFRAVRDQGASIDLGAGAVAIQTTPEAANDIDRLHNDLVLRTANGEVDPTQDIATSEYVVVPGVTAAVAAAIREAVASHWRATWARDAAIGAAIQAAADHDALDLIDVQAGSVDGEGAWP